MDSPIEEREVELIDYLNVLWRWKWLIALGTLVCLLVAGLVSTLLPKTYRIGATIDTGDLDEENVKVLDRLVARLNAGSFFRDAEGLPQTGPIELTAKFKKPFLLELQMETQSPEKAVKSIERAANKIIDDVSRLLKAQQEEDEASKRRAEEVRQSLERLRQAQSLALHREDAAGALLFVRLSDEILLKETALANLEQQSKVQLSNQRAPRLLIHPEVPRAPISPRLKLNLAASLVVGLISSVVLAFFVEYLRQARCRRGDRLVGSVPRKS